MNEILLTVIITLLVHSFVGTVVFIITKENDEFITFYGLGIIGCLICLFCCLVKVIKRLLYRYNKRSIFEDENGNRFYCKVKYSDDFCWHYEKMIKRCATKDEWEDLTPFTKEQIKLAQRNCDRCKHNDRCKFDMFRGSLDTIKCKHDNFGTVTEFNKFERK